MQAAERVPSRGDQTGLFREFSLSGYSWAFARVQLASGNLPEPAAGDVAILAQQAHPAPIVDRDSRCTTRMANDFEVNVTSVWQTHTLDLDIDNLALKHGALWQVSRVIGRFVSAQYLDLESGHPSLQDITSRPLKAKGEHHHSEPDFTHKVSSSIPIAEAAVLQGHGNATVIPPT